MGGDDDHYCNEATLARLLFEGDHTHRRAHTHALLMAVA